MAITNDTEVSTVATTLFISSITQQCFSDKNWKIIKVERTQQGSLVSHPF